ncbi:S-layer homology domain-containing protein, partial [Paenibacillus rigui]
MYKKRMISSLLSVALLSAPLFPGKGAAEAIFSDIDGSYAKDAIIQLAQAGIINGVQEGIFNPTGKLKREDFAIILAKALKLDVSNAPAAPTFQDVPPSSYAYTYVEAAVKAGIIQGTGNGAFGAGQSLSRQDMAVLYVRALGVDTTGKSAALTFADNDQISDYAKDAIGAAVELGLITGVGNNTFNPREQVDRQAVAMISTAFLKKQDTTRNSGQSQSQSEQQTKPQPTPEPVVSTDPVVSSSGSGRRNHGDTTSPTVDVSKFTAIDNYNGTPDQLTGAAGTVAEANVAVQAYLWSDQNANNIVDATELGAAISLGTSAADGSVAAANIGDLAAGSYTFVVTATDASNNESARDAAHAVTVV